VRTRKNIKNRVEGKRNETSFPKEDRGISAEGGKCLTPTYKSYRAEKAKFETMEM